MLDRLADMAATPPPITPTPQRESVGAPADQQAWSAVMDAIRGRSRSCHAMLTGPHVDLTHRCSVVVTHHAAPLAQRLADEHNLMIITQAVATVLGTGWSVHLQIPAPQVRA